MNQIKKYIPFILPSLFFLIVFILSISSLSDFDLWFHLKSGEIISKMGIIRHDVFAFTTQGRLWTPYEWLFQVVIYLFSLVFGLSKIMYLMAGISTLLIFSIYNILRKIFDLNLYISIVLCFLFFASTYEFLSPRPQIFAYTFFVINLFFIFFYYFKNKNLLFFTLPITLAWANLHGSIFLDVAFFVGFALVSLINSFLLKEKVWLSKFKVFAIYALVTFILTILPPLGTLQYQLLWRFFENRELITRFISEWTPLSISPIPFILYTIIATFTILFFAFISFRQKSIKTSLWALVVIPLILSPYLASRNAFFGYLSITLILATSFTQVKFNFSETIKKITIISGILVLLIFFSWVLFDKKREQNLDINYYPINATKFIKEHKLKGNMFNEYGFGGYLLYNLYPEQKVYFDGRTDLYLCCEMPDTLELAVQKNIADPEYKKILDNLWNKNGISFVLVRTEKHVVLRKIARILQDDPEWSLVFWDDVSQIFVRKNGKNDEIIKRLGTKAATPYSKDPFRKGLENEALREYERMIKIADSSKSRNTIGYLLLKNNEFEKAALQFETAITVYPYNESPYMNLAEISLKDQNPQKAIELYKAALKIAPDRGLIYIRLGQIFLQSEENQEGALKVWQEGLKKTVDQSAREKLEQLILAQQ